MIAGGRAVEDPQNHCTRRWPIAEAHARERHDTLADLGPCLCAHTHTGYTLYIERREGVREGSLIVRAAQRAALSLISADCLTP